MVSQDHLEDPDGCPQGVGRATQCNVVEDCCCLRDFNSIFQLGPKYKKLFCISLMIHTHKELILHIYKWMIHQKHI